MSEGIKNITVEEVVALVEYIAKSLVDDPDSVKVVIKNSDDPTEPAAADAAEADAEGTSEEISMEDEPREEGQITLELSVAKDDMGKVIGKQGRIAKAIRTVVRAATVKSDVKYRIDIL